MTRVMSVWGAGAGEECMDISEQNMYSLMLTYCQS